MSLFTWKLFARGSVLPALRKLTLLKCDISVSDLSHFVLKHCETLKVLVLWCVGLEDGSTEDFKSFLTRLRVTSKIRYLRFRRLTLGNCQVRFRLASAVGVRTAKFKGEEQV
jgi:hypothetical protein